MPNPYSYYPKNTHAHTNQTDKPATANTAGPVSYELDDAAFAANEASDPFAARFVEFLTALMGPLAQRLGGMCVRCVQEMDGWVVDFGRLTTTTTTSHPISVLALA